MGMLDEIEAGYGEYAITAPSPLRGVGECVPEPDGEEEEQEVAEQNRRAAASDPFETAKAIARAYDVMHGLSAPSILTPLPNAAMTGVTVAKLMREHEGAL